MRAHKGLRGPLGALALFLVTTTSGVASSEPRVAAVPVVPVRLDTREAPSPAIEALEKTALAAASAPVDYEAWHGVGFGAYLAPKGEFWGDDGGVDVIVHFNAAMLAGRSWQKSHANAVVVSAAFGAFGSGPYQEAMADPGRFGRMLAEVVGTLAAQRKHQGLHVRRLGIVAWSAGFGAVGRILAVPKYFAQVDSLVLLDALQAGYKDPSKGSAQGVDNVSLGGLEPYIRFAREAQAGKKQLVLTHTSIVPPEYASTTEAALAIVGAIGAKKHDTNEAFADGMVRSYRVDDGDLHVHGFRGGGPGDHMRHLHIVGDVVREYVVPRWAPKTPPRFENASL